VALGEEAENTAGQPEISITESLNEISKAMKQSLARAESWLTSEPKWHGENAMSMWRQSKQ